MRTPTLTRTVVSIASLAIGSVALVAAPATAAPPIGTTRDWVLGAAQNDREGTSSNPQADLLAYETCSPESGETQGQVRYKAIPDPDGADGILIQAVYIDQQTSRTCTFAAFATTSPDQTLSGTATMTGTSNSIQQRGDDTPIPPTPLSGDVTVTDPIWDYYDVAVAAQGEVIKGTTSTTVTSRTITPKTTQQKKAAKKARNSAVSAAKKAYAKALKKAGSSQTKKAAAKRAYTARKKAANAVYRAARAGTLTVGTTTTTTKDSSPFSFEIVGSCWGSNARC
jgi:hypothetical protein